MSEPILLLNPRRRRKNRRRKMTAKQRKYFGRRKNPAKKIRSRRRRRAYSYRKRTGRRRHSVGIRAGHYRAINPHRRRRRNPRRARRAAYTYRARHRNPSNIMGRARGLLGQATGVAVPAGVGALGGVLLDMGWGSLAASSWGAKIPQAGIAGLGAKFAAVILAGWAVKKFAPPKISRYANDAMLGASTVLLYGAARSFLHSKYPSLPGLAGYMSYPSLAHAGLSGYMPRGLLGDLSDIYSPAAVIQPPGVPVPRQFGALRGYVAVQPHMLGSGGGMAGYDYMHDGM